MQWYLEDFQFKNTERVNPLLAAADTAAAPIGFLTGSDTTRTVIARKKFPAHTSVYAGVPLHGSAVFRKLFREAGCRVWNETGDFTYPAGKWILLHSTEKGRKTVRMNSGKPVEIDLPGPGTILLDWEAGVVF